jgi:hypothetical protein
MTDQLLAFGPHEHKLRREACEFELNDHFVGTKFSMNYATSFFRSSLLSRALHNCLTISISFTESVSLEAALASCRHCAGWLGTVAALVDIKVTSNVGGRTKATSGRRYRRRSPAFARQFLVMFPQQTPARWSILTTILNLKLLREKASKMVNCAQN